ncbi:bifunctional glycosyltransferase/CDP-glycerol:glycerophosphate glycerophosphotransferase [Pseudoflavonifractor phocaeensis]|uniref:bifunctional glycosyltransferase/CDP-glycerol:glycerophosphate glycerophosphotransferase n=1 Tax=Pseudoflavonifractor phocaeensis TaxID=1870988 RepID=UPI0019567D57|nr:CDP-glycerol glycerophosphotransferase family protein [Pseudoflavonifractor phocaeensis]MBM6721508.1 CDP-glycerol glycerophosphotransferase family protein [Pseudoflavonifractor phocaeensis]
MKIEELKEDIASEDIGPILAELEKICNEFRDKENTLNKSELLAEELAQHATECSYSDIEHQKDVALLSANLSMAKTALARVSVKHALSLMDEAFQVLNDAKRAAAQSAELAKTSRRASNEAFRDSLEESKDLKKAESQAQQMVRELESFETTRTEVVQALKGIEKAYPNLKKKSLTQQKAEENDGTMVTVVCITYGHEKYIAQALDSFLMQKTNFKFKIFVGEDCGPDGTADIVREYARKYPDLIVPFIREKNMGPQRNCLDMCAQATSPYIALCDGDDYWIDEYKLQKQFDYMESHPQYRYAFAKTEIIAGENWAHAAYYRPNKEGRYIIPDCLRNYKLPKPPLRAGDFIDELLVGHTSTLFFRWNYDIDYPEWFFEGVFGDAPLRLMQIGSGEIGYIEDVVSVYRVNETGVFTSYRDRDEMFLKTRMEYVRWMSGILDWYQSNGITQYPKVKIENRLIVEINNLIDAATKKDRCEEIIELFVKYPEAAKRSMRYYISANNDRRALERTFGWAGYQAVVRNRTFRNLIRPYAKLAAKILKWKSSSRVKKWKQKLKNIASWGFYWLYTPVPKRKNLWVVSGFRKNTYMDNTRYFYEYVVKHHPEIEIYWLTKSREIYTRLQREGKPVLFTNTWKCIRKLSRASIAVVDHYAVSDFERPSGFNDRTKVVQLWHGVGFKNAVSMDGKITAGEPGVVSSLDILPQPGDRFLCKVKKRLKYFRHAYYRELFEQYFLFLTPGQEMINRMAKAWGIPEKSWFTCGYPRTRPMLQTAVEPDSLRILYAPTYRWHSAAEQTMVRGFLGACADIQTLMEEIDGIFTLRIHPHTWRNYQMQITKGISRYDRIQFDLEKDVYPSLAQYSMVISDYSSIIIDFAILNRPTIYFCPDLDEYRTQDTGLVAEFEQQITGPLTKTWEETFNEIRNYIQDPKKDADWAMERCAYFYNPETTDVDNSERIVCEIKKRLNF